MRLTTLCEYKCNVKLGKYKPEEGDTEANQEEYESLNDIEKVLGMVGIKYRKTATELRNFDEVFNEIGTKFNSWDQVKQNAVAGTIAGNQKTLCLNI